MVYRPIVDLPKTKREKVWDWIGGGFFIATMLYIIVMWSKIPDKVPGHFNGAGEVDRWGSKIELFILPFIGVFLWILMSLLEKAPHMYNYPARLNENNVEVFYLSSRKVLNEVKNYCLILFAIISIQMVRIALGDAHSLGLWFLPLIIIGTAFPIIRGLVASSKIK